MKPSGIRGETASHEIRHWSDRGVVGDALGGCAVLLMGPSPHDKHRMEAECRSRGASPLCWKRAVWKRKDVRPGIEAATQHLRAYEFTDIKDLPDPERCPTPAECSPTQWFQDRAERDRERAFEERVQFHLMHVSVGEEVRLLRLSYVWLTDHSPEEVRSWLDKHEVGRELREAGRSQVSIHDDETMGWR